MIYINSNTNLVQIPKHIHYEAEDLQSIWFQLENNVTHEIYTYPNLTNKALKTNFYEFELEVDVPVGEYKYLIMIDGDIIEKGLLVFGDYKKDVNAYKSNTDVIQYKK